MCGNVVLNYCFLNVLVLLKKSMYDGVGMSG